MIGEIDDKTLDRLIADLIKIRSTRGRPRTGLTKASQYSDEYWQLRNAGASSWHAKEKVAANNQKTVQHISACVKMINETPPHEYLEPDRTEDTE